MTANSHAGLCGQGATSPSQKVLVGTIPAALCIAGLNCPTLNLPLAALTTHGFLHDEVSHRKDTPTGQPAPLEYVMVVATKSGAAALDGLCRICHL